MHIFLTPIAVLTAACIALLVLCFTHSSLKRYFGTARSGAFRESLSLSAGCFAVLATVSIGAIYLAGSACRLDVTQVQSVDRGSMAAIVGFNAGDVITHVNGRHVGSLYDVLEPLSVGRGMILSVVRGRHSLDLLVPATLLNAGPTPDAYGLHFPILTKSLSLSEAVRQWAHVANYYLGTAAGVAVNAPPFLVGVRFMDTFTFMLTTLSILLPIAMPLLVFYRRWSSAPITRVAEQEIPRENVYADA